MVMAVVGRTAVGVSFLPPTRLGGWGSVGVFESRVSGRCGAGREGGECKLGSPQQHTS